MSIIASVGKTYTLKHSIAAAVVLTNDQDPQNELNYGTSVCGQTINFIQVSYLTHLL